MKCIFEINLNINEISKHIKGIGRLNDFWWHWDYLVRIKHDEKLVENYYFNEKNNHTEMAKVNKLLSSLSIIFIIFSCSTDSDSSPSDTNSSLSETFGSWSPDFTDQKTSFDQTRTGSNGTQQTRTISVSSGSNSEVTTEKNLSQDINQDDDLFDEIEKVIITYTASENLGSFQEIDYNLAEDNNNGITIGNNFYPIDNGGFQIYKVPQEWLLNNDSGDDITCNGYTLHELDLYLFSNDITYGYDGDGSILFSSQSGGGTMIYMEMLSIFTILNHSSI